MKKKYSSLNYVGQKGSSHKAFIEETIPLEGLQIKEDLLTVEINLTSIRKEIWAVIFV